MAGTIEGLGNKIWNNDEFSAFSTQENTKNYQNYKKQLEEDYDKNYSIGGNFWNWAGQGLSGGGWSKEDYLKNHGLDADVDKLGMAGSIGNSGLKMVQNAARQYNQQRARQLEKRQGLFSGVPLVGEILSPITQVASSPVDSIRGLVKGIGEGDWSFSDVSKRDPVSDIAAAVETALMFSGGAGAGASLGTKIGTGALKGAVGGAAASLNKMGMENFDLEQLAKNTAISSLIGGGIGAASYGVGKLGDIAKAHRAETTVVPSNQITYDDMGNVLGKSGISYQDALKKVGLDQYSNPSDYSAIQSILRGDALSEDLLNDPSRIASLTGKFNNMTEMLGGTPDYHATAGIIPTSPQGQNLQDLYSAIQNWGKALDVQPTAYQITTYPGLYSGKVFPKLTRAGQGIGDIAKDIYTQYGNKDAILNLLNNNYARLGAGVGAGLLTTNLLRNNNKKEGE